MQLLISAILTLALGTGAFFGLNQHPNLIVGSANGQGKETVKAETTENIETSPTPTGTPSSTLTVTPSPTAITDETKINNGLHLRILRGRHLGEGKEELNENAEAEVHENEHSTPTPTPSGIQTSIGVQTSVISNNEEDRDN